MFDASWDRQFYMLTDGTKTTVGTYVSDLGDGLKEIPVVYFPAMTVIDVNFASVDDALAQGGQLGYLMFSTNSASVTLSLYAVDPYSSIAEVPKSSLGLVIPIVYCIGVIMGIEVYEFVGGFEFNWYSWDDSLTVLPVDASIYFDQIDPPLEYLTIDMMAFDEVRLCMMYSVSEIMTFSLTCPPSSFYAQDTGGYSLAYFVIDSFGAATNIYSEDVPGQRQTASSTLEQLGGAPPEPDEIVPSTDDATPEKGDSATLEPDEIVPSAGMFAPVPGFMFALFVSAILQLNIYS
jgi:hypothetical protein